MAPFAPERADAEGFVAAVTSDGYMLVFDATELPELGRGKGNRLIKLAPGAELIAVTFLQAHQSLIITAGQAIDDVETDRLGSLYRYPGRRGGQLPRGLQRVDSIEAQA